MKAGARMAMASAFLAATAAVAQTAGGMAALPLRRESADDPSMLGAWGFLLLLGAVASAAVWMRRTRKPASAATVSLEKLESVSLTAQVSLHVVRWGSEEVLVACAPGAVQVLSRRAPQAAPEGPRS